PHLKYGHVMFNKNLRTIRIYEFSRGDGAHHSIADLVQTPAIGYRHARVGLDVYSKPDYLKELCFLDFKSRHEELTFYANEYQIGVDPRTPSSIETLRCDAHGLAPL